MPAERWVICGRVQGVGFRPFAARLAASVGLEGWVRNAPEGVEIHVQGDPDKITEFRKRMEIESPPGAAIVRVESRPAAVESLGGFSIRASAGGTGEATARAVIPPDRATCGRCQAEFADPGDRRHGYALSSCTECGPRLTILAALPFDRERTSMADFEPCDACQREFADATNRRFHAQNIACPACGPKLWLETPQSAAVEGSRSGIGDLPVLQAAAEILRRGGILAVKGVGGFHLLCDACSAAAVGRLRARKRRDRKPFAVMFGDLDEAAWEVELDEPVRRALSDPAAPIVLLKRRPESRLAAGIAPGLGTVGSFLAYTLVHRELVRLVGKPLVATSGNSSDEPMPLDNETARRELGAIADGLLMHDRRILRQADDSVVRPIAGRMTPIRIGRGIAPLRLELPLDAPAILALGGHLKTAVAVTRGREMYLGQHLGDLTTAAARRRYREAVADFLRLVGVKPLWVAHDAHPDYFTTRLAEESGLRRFAVQHHHAHALACLAEHGEQRPALAIVWDGTGYGADGSIWGGEFLLIDAAGFRRVGSLWPFPLVGGDRAAREPRLAAAGVCAEAGFEDTWPGEQGGGRAGLIRTAAAARSAFSTTTSAGRLFDAWAAFLLALDRSDYEGEAAMRLEQLADPDEAAAFEVKVVERDGPEGDRFLCLDWRPWVEETRLGLQRGDSPARLAARFHNALAVGSLKLAQEAGREQVVLSGGCFQNALLTQRVSDALGRHGFRVLTHVRLPAGDGGLAAGQAWAAALHLSAIHEREGGGDVPGNPG